MKYFAANWKLQKSPTEARRFFADLIPSVDMAASLATKRMIFFPSAFALEASSMSLQNRKIAFGPQNVFSEGKGAFTGENSASVAKDMGASYVLLGHSERRTLFAETDQSVAKKVKYVQDLEITPLLCFGEVLAEREAGLTNSVLEKQLTDSLALADRQRPLMLAYEPVWAIGTGKVATPAQVAEAHAHCVGIIKKLGFSGMVPLLYGGSVKADNAKELIRIPHVDGFLIGGASLEVKSFLDICNCV